MLVLGLETSCDDTAAAVLQDGHSLLSNVINDQTDIHSKFGGIVPELAGRSHIDIIHRVIDQSLQFAQVELKDIDLIAVTKCPGLIGSLLVGVNIAKGISHITYLNFSLKFSMTSAILPDPAPISRIVLFFFEKQEIFFIV